MQLLAFWLLVVAGHSVMAASLSQVQLGLLEIGGGLNILNKHLLHTGQTLSTPETEDIKECCSGHALQCFSETLPELKVTSEKAEIIKKRIIRTLQKGIIQKNINSCSEEATKNAVCQACSSYPLRDSQTFVRAFKTLQQRANDMMAHRR